MRRRQAAQAQNTPGERPRYAGTAVEHKWYLALAEKFQTEMGPVHQWLVESKHIATGKSGSNLYEAITHLFGGGKLQPTGAQCA